MRGGPAFVLAIASVGVALSGCLEGEAPGVQTLRLDVPPPADLLPSTLAGRPPGLETPISPRDAPFPRLLDGHTRIFDGAVDGVGVQTVASAMRFEDEDAAQAAFALIADEVGAHSGSTRPALGDEAVQRLVPSEEGSSVLAVRKGTVLWMVQHAAMGPGVPAPDLAPLIQEHALRVP